MSIIKCPECGHQVSDQARTCPSCGIDIAGHITKCPNCNEIVFNNQPMCPNCHVALQPVAPLRVASVMSSASDANPERSDAPERQSSSRRKGVWGVLVVAFVIALGIVLLGAYFYYHTQRQNELEAYENAMQSSEPAVLQNYLDMYVNAPMAHRDSVEAHLLLLKQVDVDWANAVATRSKSSLLQYLKKYPNSVHQAEAKLLIDSLDWVSAGQANTPEAYQTYLQEHSDGAHYDEAQTAYDRLMALVLSPADRELVIHYVTAYFSNLALKDTQPNVHYTFGEDWQIEKQEVDNGMYIYKVGIVAHKKVETPDVEPRTEVTVYNVTASVTPEGKVSDVEMQKAAQ